MKKAKKKTLSVIKHKQLHLGIMRRLEQDLPRLIGEGYTSFKVYLT